MCNSCEPKKEEMKKEGTLYPFDLEAAKRGEPIQTRNGLTAFFIGIAPTGDQRVVVAVVVAVGDKVIDRFSDNGHYLRTGRENSWDLFMAPKPKATKTEFVRLVRRRSDGALLTTVSRPSPDMFDVIGAKRVTFTEGEFDSE